jgi:hypothetical protein
MTLKDYLSSYEGDVPISVLKNSEYLCHGVLYEDIRNQSWYEENADKYVISFKVIKDEMANNETVLLLMM